MLHFQSVRCYTDREGSSIILLLFLGRAPIWETVARAAARLGFPTRAGFACGGVGETVAYNRYRRRWVLEALGPSKELKLPGYQSNLPWSDAKVNRPVFLYFPVHSSESREV